MSPAAGVLAYLAAVNGLAFAVFGHDKRAAMAGGRRVPELRLLGLAMAGGSLGAICGQQLFRHKTRKQPFAALLYLILAAQAALAVVLLARR